MTNTKAAPKKLVMVRNLTAVYRMSDEVIEIELRQAWAEIECNMRHGNQPSAWQSDYTAALEGEKARRAASREAV